jgi:DtxR family Mn-dependent transcriptional regulator
MPTSTVEDYLKCILMLQEHETERRIGMGQIAAALDVAPGTVTAMMKTLSDSGLVDYEPYSGVRLTVAGEKLAAHVLRRHRLIELFLVQVMELDWSHVHEEAERLEHAVSERLIERMDEMLGRPSVDPHGDPIPDAKGYVDRPDFPDLLRCPVGKTLTVARVSDQSEEFLREAETRGLVPGSEVRVEERDESEGRVELTVGEGRRFRLGYRSAAKVQVKG